MKETHLSNPALSLGIASGLIRQSGFRPIRINTPNLIGVLYTFCQCAKSVFDLETKLFRPYAKKNSPCHQEKILEVGESDFIFWDWAFLEILRELKQLSPASK